MKPSHSLRDQVRGRHLSLGTWIQLPDTYSAEIISRAGFDWLAIDLEHGLIDLQAAFRLIQIIGLTGCVPLVRLNENDPSLIRRVMDAGAGGVIVPMVNTVEDAEQAVYAVKYSPDGRRSFGLGRAHRFGVAFDDYLKTANEQSVVVIQIEHIDALQNLDRILAVKGIDAIIIGPYDMSGSLGIPGKFDDPRFEQVIGTVIDRVKKSGIALGFHIVHPSQQDLEKRISEGFTFIGYGMDTIFISEGSLAAVRDARSLPP